MLLNYIGTPSDVLDVLLQMQKRLSVVQQEYHAKMQRDIPGSHVGATWQKCKTGECAETYKVWIKVKDKIKPEVNPYYRYNVRRGVQYRKP